jgi:hypothetical protein
VVSVAIDTQVFGSLCGAAGVVGALPVDSSTVSVEEGFPLGAPLAYFVGHDSGQGNPDLYKHYVE